MGSRRREHELETAETCLPGTITASCKCGGWKADVTAAFKGEDLKAKATKKWAQHRDLLVRQAPRLLAASEVMPEAPRRRRELGYR